QAEDGIRDRNVTGVQTCALPILVNSTESWMTPALMPFLVFIIGMFISFSTGTSWGTMAILTPIAIPLAYTIGGEALIPLAIGAIFSGSIYGDHVSPISDTTI